MARSTKWRRALLRGYMDKLYHTIGCYTVTNGAPPQITLARARKAWRLWQYLEFSAQYYGEKP